MASDIVFQPLHPDTGALSHSRGAQFALSLMEYGHPEIFLFMCPGGDNVLLGWWESR